MMSDLHTIHTSADADAFATGYTDLALALYGNANASVHLRSGSRPFAKYAIAVRTNGTAVAQCILYENPYLSIGGHPALLLGNLEFAEDYHAFALMLKAVEAYAAQQGISQIAGPINGSTWDSYRYAVPDGNPTFSSEPLQKPYYPAFLERWGFLPLYRYRTTEAPAGADAVQLRSFKESAAAAGFSIRSLTPETFQEDLKKLYPMLQRAFSEAALFSPIPEKEFLERYMPMQAVLRPGYTLVADDSGGNPAACLLGFPDAYRPDRAILKTVARDPLCRDKMIARALALNFSEAAAADGKRTILHAFIRDDNEASRRRSEELGSRPYRQYLLYKKRVNAL